MFNKNLWSYATSQKFSLCLMAIAGFLSGVAILLQAYFTAKIANDAIFEGKGMDVLLLSFALLLLIITLRMILTYSEEHFAANLSNAVQNELNQEILHKYSMLGVSQLTNEPIGNFLNMTTEGMKALDVYFRNYLPQLFKAMAIQVLFLIIVFPMDIMTGIIMLLTAPLVPMFMILIGKWTKKTTAKSWQVLARISAYLQDVLQGLETLKQLGQGKRQKDKIEEISKEFTGINMKVLRVAFLSALTLELITTISIALVAVGLGVRLVDGEVGFQIALFLILLAPEFYLPLRSLGTQFHGSLNGIEAAKTIFTFLEQTETEIENNNSSINEEKFNIELINITFNYNESQPTIENINLKAKSGQLIALVGASGGGKSTILKLLAGLLTEQSGEFRINNRTLAIDERQVWRENISYISQNPHIFARTLWENIAMNSGASLAEVQAICREIGANNFIENLPNSYETMLGDGGTTLSGGEAQLIGIARAFAKKSPVIICDEATQSLDLLSEKAVLFAFDKLFVGRTVIISAHRLQTVTQADKIYLIEGGKVAEVGNYQELIAENNKFSTLIQGRQVNNYA